jgi:hypothetical protein
VALFKNLESVAMAPQLLAARATRAMSARFGRSTLLIVSRIPGMEQACRAAKTLSPLGRSRDPARDPSLVLALQASPAKFQISTLGYYLW